MLYFKYNLIISDLQNILENFHITITKKYYL